MVPPFIGRLTDFLDRSPTPWHAVANVSELLEHAGFVRLDERSAWALEAGASYFVVRSDGALVAWRQPSDVVSWTLFGAHTDSPNLRVRPEPRGFVAGLRVGWGAPPGDRHRPLAVPIADLQQEAEEEEEESEELAAEEKWQRQ